jgi:hypothetical protein
LDSSVSGKWKQTFGFHKVLWNSWVAEQLLDSQGISCVELVTGMDVKRRFQSNHLPFAECYSFVEQSHSWHGFACGFSFSVFFVSLPCVRRRTSINKYESK